MRDPTRELIDVVPGEAVHRPSQVDEIILPNSVMSELPQPGMELVSVDFNRVAKLRIGEVDHAHELAMRVEHRVLGDGRRDADAADIRRALALYRTADAILIALLAVAAAAVVLIAPI